MSYNSKTNDRKLVQAENSPKSMVPETLVMEGGTIKGSGGLLIDGTLTKCHIVSTDGSLIHLSALSTLEECTIDGEKVLFEGNASGSFTVNGDCEIGASAVMMGTLHTGGDVWISKLADKKDLSMNSLAKKAVDSFDTGSHITLAAVA